MKRQIISAALALLPFLFNTVAAQAAGLITIDPIPGVVVHPATIIARTHGINIPNPLPTPVLKGSVTFGLRLKEEQVKVTISDQVARTYVSETFSNDSDRNLSGTYLFPLPEDTTFSSFTLHIDGKPVEGQILEASAARQEYESIVRRMVDPGLLEYADYKTVRLRIFPIPAHGTKKVELEYTQVLKGQDGLLQYRFPLQAHGQEASVDNVAVNVQISGKQGVKTIWSPSQTINAKHIDEHRAEVAYLAHDVVLDHDFQLYYSLSNKDVAANLITHKTADEDGYFLLTINAPTAAKQTIGKDIVLLADVSGSMAGEKIDQAKKALKYIVNALHEGDRFNIIDFASDVEKFRSGLVSADSDSKKQALSFIEGLDAHGGTDIGDALHAGASMLSGKDRPSYLVLVTDGEPSVGITDPKELIKQVAADKQIRLFDFGVGYDVNTRLLNKLADSHHGATQYVEPDEDLEVALSNFYNKIKSPVLSDVNITYDGVQVAKTYPQEVKDLFAGSQVLLLGRYHGAGNAHVHLTGSINGVKKSYDFPLTFAADDSDHTYLKRLWAMRRIGYLTDIAQDNGDNKEVIDEIVQLSKKYGIISQYTSFLATDPSEQHRLGMMTAPMPTGMPPISVARGASMHGMNAPRQIQIVDARPSVAASWFGIAGGGGSVGSPAPIAMAAGSANSFVGRDAVKQAKMSQNYKSASVASSSASTQVQGVKTIEDKTFYIRNGVWVDNDYNATTSPKPEIITFGSARYFDLIKSVHGILPYLSVGKEVLLVYKTRCYKIVAATQS